MARIFSNIFRFIDDLCTFNNDEFENNYDNIFPDELELKNLVISIEVKKWNLPLSRLIRDMPFLPFYINRMSYCDSNIPSKKFYGLIGSEVLRIARATTDLINMEASINLLLKRTKNQARECTSTISLS